MLMLKKILQANKKYANNFGSTEQLHAVPQKKVAVLTCMDTRLDPLQFMGLELGDAHVIRNAGGRASSDALRSLIVSHQLLGTQEFFVIHHTECGMLSFNSEVMRKKLEQSLSEVLDDKTIKHSGKNLFDLVEEHHIDWMGIEDHEKCLLKDVDRIRKHPLIAKGIPIYGYIYDVHTGKLREVTTAIRAGEPR
jgi:carbonic anhydrase